MKLIDDTLMQGQVNGFGFSRPCGRRRWAPPNTPW